MATAARVTIAEAGEILPVGELDPRTVVTPHLYVDTWCERRERRREGQDRRAAPRGAPTPARW
jgi:hypothetical protein